MIESGQEFWNYRKGLAAVAIAIGALGVSAYNGNPLTREPQITSPVTLFDGLPTPGSLYAPYIAKENCALVDRLTSLSGCYAVGESVELIIFASGDEDGDGVVNIVDIAPGFNDNGDYDGDGVPLKFDRFPLANDKDDRDANGFPDWLQPAPNTTPEAQDIANLKATRVWDDINRIISSDEYNLSYNLGLTDKDGDTMPDILDSSPETYNRSYDLGVLNAEAWEKNRRDEEYWDDYYERQRREREYRQNNP